MTDASLPIFSVDAQKKRIQTIEGKQRPIEGGGVHLASKTDHF